MPARWRSAAALYLGKLGLHRAKIGLGLLKLELEISRINLSQRLASLDLVANLDIDRRHRAGLLKGQRDCACRRDRS